jgi:hypothetical protein
MGLCLEKPNKTLKQNLRDYNYHSKIKERCAELFDEINKNKDGTINTWDFKPFALEFNKRYSFPDPTEEMIVGALAFKRKAPQDHLNLFPT